MVSQIFIHYMILQIINKLILKYFKININYIIYLYYEHYIQLHYK